jgi:hypothetical protein
MDVSIRELSDINALSFGLLFNSHELSKSLVDIIFNLTVIETFLCGFNPWSILSGSSNSFH